VVWKGVCGLVGWWGVGGVVSLHWESVCGGGGLSGRLMGGGGIVFLPWDGEGGYGLVV
jgi:hypothetical protein